jgi:hypothetical protein
MRYVFPFDSISPGSEPIAADLFPITHHPEPASFMQAEARRIILHDARLKHPEIIFFLTAKQFKQECLTGSMAPVVLPYADTTSATLA